MTTEHDHLHDRLVLTCTDRGQHPSAELVMIDWTRDDDTSVWTPGSGGGTAEIVDENTRAGRRGGAVHRQRPTDHHTWVDRADGGRTLQVRCRRCGRDYRVRDDRLEQLRTWQSSSLDLSLTGW